MDKESKKKMPFWLQLIAILLAGVIASCGVYFSIRDYNTERFTVTFAYGDGSLIKTEEVKAGKGVFPPELDSDYVFRGWDRTLNQINNNLEAHPDLYKAIEDNLFYFDSVYVQEGQSFTLDLMLGGTVNLSSGEVILVYDEDVMEYKSYQALKSVGITKTGKGELTIKLDSNEPIIQKTELAQIKFRARKANAEFTQAVLSAKSAKLVLGGDEKTVDCATINNKIFFMQEVG